MQDILTFINNHLLLNLLFIGVLFAVVMVEFAKQKNNTASLTPIKLTQLINHENALVIDTRDAEAYAQGHVIGAVAISASELSNSKKLEKYRSRPIIIVCATGQESARLATTLHSQGFDTRVLNGGMRAWRDADMPTVKE